jgi:hypothetical protein
MDVFIWREGWESDLQLPSTVPKLGASLADMEMKNLQFVNNQLSFLYAPGALLRHVYNTYLASSHID